jgi:ribonuclease I
VIKSKRMRWARHVSCMGEKEIAYFMGRNEGKRTIGRPMRRWKHNIKIDLQEIGHGRVLD